jgi:hypothetical protein
MVLVMNSLQTVSFTSALQKLIEFFIPKLSVVFLKPNVSKPDLFWRVNDSTDWELLKSSLQLEFDNFSLIDDNVGNVDSTWEVWKGKVTRRSCK